MKTIDARRFWEPLFAAADIRLDGRRPEDIRVLDERFFDRLLRGGELGAGESFMDGDWDCERLDVLAAKAGLARLRDRMRRDWRTILAGVRALVVSPNRRSKAFEIGRRHYDLGNDLYSAMLDRRMVYTCAYWRGLEQVPENLDRAQEAKLDLVCRKLSLAPGMRVLDIGGGWGSFARFAAEKYGARVVSMTVSREQKSLADRLCEGLPVVNRLQDYRAVDEPFDRVVSLGMFEHVGRRNYRTYMRVARRCLREGGIFLLHTIADNASELAMNAWTAKHIFPNSELPSAAQIAAAAEGLFVVEDWHNLGPYYDPTLMAWWHNFHAAWPRLRDKYGEKFYRTWKLYLQGSAGGFRARTMQVWQVVLSVGGVPGGAQAFRST
ncbi:MAG TPA: cyclopropane fatty acyl phospholipid synthase [Elusimicrobiota bacterium]|jgi:cyclopropane-fatty-acyl-phospholipid synthase|nr:cyclopropane fatty acyl phospholipid synthase [Elusimicrobiota bacterium]